MLKFEFDCQDFLKAFQAVERSVELKKGKKDEIIISVGAAGAVLHAANSTEAVSAIIFENGIGGDMFAFSMPGGAVGGFVKKLVRRNTTGTLVLSSEEGRGSIELNGSSVQFETGIPENLDVFIKGNAKLIGRVRANDLYRIVTDGTVATGNLREKFPAYIVQAQFKVSSDGTLSVVTTDGKRLALSKCEFEHEDDVIGDSWIVHVQGLRELARLAKKRKDELVSIFLGESRVFFILGFGIIRFSLPLSYDSSGRVSRIYPNYERLLSDEYTTSLEVDFNTLNEAIDSVGVVATKLRSKSMIFRLNSETDVKLYSVSGDGKDLASKDFKAVVSGNHLVLGFNIDYFRDGLKMFGDGTVRLELNSAEGLSRFTQAGRDNLYMLMPVRLSDEDLLPEDRKEKTEQEQQQKS